jgi:lipooligosaccharide transport system permease protein
VALTVGLDQENIYPMISRVVIFPLFLFSGAFFPVEDMPSAVGAFAKVTPSWHGVEIARHLALGDLARVDIMHIGYLVAFAAVGFFLVQRQFRKHLDK